MQNRRLGSAAVIVVAIGALLAVPIRVAAEPPTLQDGEIQLNGVVREVNPTSMSFTMTTESFTVPGRPEFRFPAPRAKTVLVLPETAVQSEEDGSPLKLSDFRHGMRVTVIGRDLGIGTELPARIVLAEGMPGQHSPRTLFVFSQGGKMGYMDRTGQVVIRPQYDIAADVFERIARVCVGGKWGFINEKGEALCPLQYDMAGDFKDGMARVLQNGQWGYVGRRGTAAIAPQYASEGDYSEGLAAVKTGGRWGYIDRAGVIAIQSQFDVAGPFNDGLAAVQTAGKTGYIDRTGQFVEPK